MRSSLLLVATVAALVPSSAAAAPLAAVPPVRCGEVITRNTTLRADLTDCPGSGIVIGGDDVVLDLGGHTIDGDGVLGCEEQYACDFGVDNTAGHAGLTIEHGTIRDFAAGTFVDGASRTRVGAVTFTRNALSGLVLVASTQSKVTGSTFVGNGLTTDQAGVSVLGSSGLLLGSNRVGANGDLGIYLDGVTGAHLLGNSISGNPEGGVLLGGNGNELRGNHIFDNGDNVAINGDDNVVAGNVVTTSRGFADDPVGGFGILVDGGSRNAVTANLVDRSRSNGIRIVSFDPDAAGPSADNVVRGNAVSRSRLEGILVDETAPGTSVERNLVSAGAGDGIDVRSATSTVTRNFAWGNAALGIDAEPGVIDGGANRAYGNGAHPQCRGVRCA